MNCPICNKQFEHTDSHLKNYDCGDHMSITTANNKNIAFMLIKSNINFKCYGNIILFNDARYHGEFFDDPIELFNYVSKVIKFKSFL